MDERQEIKRLGNFCHANFPEECKQIAKNIGSGNIIDVAIELLEYLDTDIAIVVEEKEELQREIVRHHKDFERWEEIADKGAQQLAEVHRLREEYNKLAIQYQQLLEKSYAGKIEEDSR